MGFLATSRIPLDYLVVETGVGGLWDTTNSLKPEGKLCVITQIGFDHMNILGSSLEEIAAHKAGIIQKGSTVVALKQDEEVNAIITKRCEQMQASLTWVEASTDYQTTNDNLAVQAVTTLAERDGWQFDESLIKPVLQSIFIPGRFEKRDYNNHLLILDGAHNPQKIGALCHRLQSEKLTPCNFILAIGERKDAGEVLQAMKSCASKIITTEFFTEQQDIPKRPLDREELASLAVELGIPAISAKTPSAALALAKKESGTIVATGSFYLLPEIDQAM